MIVVVRPRQNRGSHFVARLAAVWFLLLAFSFCQAAASDFVINYAIEANGKTDSGKLENCDDERICRFRAADLDVEILVYPGDAGVATIDMIVRGPPGCCYFADAEKRFRSTVKPGLLRLAIYRRMQAARDDFVRNAFSWNQPIGTIHLGVSRSRPAK